MTSATDARAASAMIEALQADGPYSDYADKLMQFGRLVGSWDIEGRFFDADGNVTREGTPGEWHFGWALEGRAIQDVLLVPPCEGREPEGQSRSCDTAVRVYDPKIDAWRITVIFGVYGATVNHIARQHGDEIWLEGRSPENEPIRWTFSEFSEDRVLWQGFASKDEGRTWIRDEEIVLHRRKQLP
jgi:hypothetical protein